MEVGLRESCFAENLLEQLHGAKVEAAETSPKSRRRCCRVDVRSIRQPNQQAFAKHCDNLRRHS